ncbi:MAG: preprotein translocase subunit SecG [Bacteroidales bacterium]|nr:preprotein translocase subunit SecG [Bacteroidales bacterium]
MGLYILVAVLILVVCFFLGLIVLVQDSKGGGLASNFSSSNQYMGVRKTADFLEKSTWTLAILLLAFSLISVIVIPRGGAGSGLNSTEQMLQEKAQQGTLFNNFTPAPEQQGSNPVEGE